MLTIEEIKRRNTEAGLHYFDPDTMRFFKSRVSSTVYQGPGGVFFVTSEKPPHGPRRYTPRMFLPNGGCETAYGVEFCILSRRQAHKLARKMAGKVSP